MDKNKIKEILDKIGKASLPAMMLMGMAWNSHATALTATELGIRAKEERQKTQPAIEVVDNDNDNENYQQLIQWGCDTCSGGCTGGCFGCTGTCTGCSNTCSGGCTGCGGACSNGCTGCEGGCTGCTSCTSCTGTASGSSFGFNW